MGHLDASAGTGEGRENEGPRRCAIAGLWTARDGAGEQGRQMGRPRDVSRAEKRAPGNRQPRSEKAFG